LSIYVDSSFLVSRYIEDSHSSKVDHVLAEKPSVGLTPFNIAELSNAIFRQAFLKRLEVSKAQLAWGDFEQDCSTGIWVLLAFPDHAWETSVELAHQHGPTLGVRTLDLLHIACAVELNADAFWTFDERQARLARAVGLTVVA
jgi:predicted nucleic acid-binding protein